MRKLINLLCLLSVIPILYVLFVYNNSQIEVEYSKCFILNDVSEEVVYEKLSDNIVKCDVSGVSNVVNNLILDGWSVTKYDVTPEFIDVILEKEGKVYRVYYEASGTLTTIAAPYESTKEILTYINDRE